jgi:6-phosphogluconate dehydrogenase
MGVLGTDKELQKGCGMLISGPRDGFDLVEENLKKAAREVDYESTLAYIGTSVSASYTMLVLNSIITAEQQVLAEVMSILHAAGFTNEEVSKSIGTWNKDDLESPMLETVVQVLRKKDQDVDGCESTENALIDMVVDSPALFESAATFLREINDRKVGAQALAASVYEALWKDRKEERAKCIEIGIEIETLGVTVLEGPEFDWSKLDHVQLVEDLRNVFVCCQLVIFAEGCDLLKSASDDYEWSIEMSGVARVIASCSEIRNGLLSL